MFGTDRHKDTKTWRQIERLTDGLKYKWALRQKERLIDRRTYKQFERLAPEQRGKRTNT